MTRPEYCAASDETVPCPACGATAGGDDPVRGVCQARHSGRPPEHFISLVLVDKKSGDVVAESRGYH